MKINKLNLLQAVIAIALLYAATFIFLNPDRWAVTDDHASVGPVANYDNDLRSADNTIDTAAIADHTVKSSDGTPPYIRWGISGDRPIPGNYDRNGKTDIAIFRPTDNTWYLMRSLNGRFTARRLASPATSL